MSSTLATVIGRGLASAKPGTPTEGYIYYSTDTGALERYSGSAWESIGGGGGGLIYAFSTTTADADPGAGTLRFDNATPASVTNIYIDDTDEGGSIDLSTVFANLQADTRVWVEQIGTPANYILGKITGVTDGTGYYKLTITIDDSGTLPDNGAALRVVFFPTFSGGGGSTNWWDDPKCNIISYAVLHDGDILNPIGEPIAVLSGSVDGDGNTGVSGFTETTVACSCIYDISPAVNTARGYNWFDQDIPLATGQYFRTSVRFPIKDDQSLFVGFGESSQFEDAGIKIGGEGVGIHLQGGTDTNWQVVHNDGSTGQTKVDTGRAWGTDDWLNVEIYIWDTGGGTMNAKVWINGTLEATITTNLPSATNVTCRPFIQSWFQSAGATATYDQIIFVNHGFWASYDAGELETNGWATL